MIRKILGCILLSLPFVGVFIFGIKSIGLKWIILGFIFASIIVSVVMLGSYLIVS